MSATESGYTSTEETLPKRSSHKSARPQSIMAVNFADQLNNIFLIDDTLDELATSVEKKRFSLTSHTAELEALEARLRHTEELLEEKKKRLSLPADPAGVLPPRSPPPPPEEADYSPDSAPPMPNTPPLPPPKDESATEAKEGYVVVERSPSVVNAGGMPPMPTRMAPAVPVE